MESENRAITHISSLIITILMLSAFSFIWLYFYNDIVFRTNKTQDAILCIFVWLLLYLKFSKVYRSFKIASNAVSEIAFSQFLSVAFSDLILYIAGCLIARQYINVFPGAVIVIVQVLIGVVWAVLAKKYFLNNVNPQKCLLLFENNCSEEEQIRRNHIIEKLEYKYAHLFDFAETYGISDDVTESFSRIDSYPVVFIDNLSAEKRNVVIGHCVGSNKRFYMIPTLEDAIACGYQVKHFIDTPILSYSGEKEIQTYAGKRALDIIISFLFLVLLSPLMLIVACSIKVEDHGPVLFKQKRVGARGKIFKIYKFRSMIVDAEADGKPRPAVDNDPRITRVGKIIRKTRIDELPQFLNILKGDISIVGPRPERVEHVELYTKKIPEFSYRLMVPQGLTGYAQIYGKYNTSPRDKLLLDLFYIEQQNLIMDLKIFMLTIKTVFTPESTEGFDDMDSKNINKNSSRKEEKSVEDN